MVELYSGMVWGFYRGLHLACAVVWVSACSDTTDVQRVQDLQVELKEVPARVGTMRWLEVAKIRVMPPGTPASEAHFDSEDDSFESEGALESPVTTDDLILGRRYLLEETISFERARSSTGIDVAQDPDLASASEQAEEELLVPKGWSDDTGNGNGNDARIDRSTTLLTVYRRFGYLGTGCTATMVRQTSNGTFAMTAAHCVYDSNGDPIATTFEPAAGSAAAAGLWDVTTITRYDAWVSNGCGATSTSLSNCRQWDIALLWLAPRSGTTYLGGITYGSRSPSQIAENTTNVHRGYPGCGSPGAPTGCTGTRLWGDGAHAVAGFSHSDRLFRHSSDTSPGHSGGPMYALESLGFDNVLYAVNTSETCNGKCNGNSNQPHVNRARRIDNNWYDVVYDIINN